MRKNGFGSPLMLVALALGFSGCRGCEERHQARLHQMASREAACYVVPLREAIEAVRRLLTEDEFPLPVLDETGLIVTGWKDTTVRSSRLTFAGRPARARREVFVAGAPCLRFAVRAIAQSTPKKGPDYADTDHSQSYEEDNLAARIHERLHGHERAWTAPVVHVPATVD